MKKNNILLGHGSGGKLSHELIKNIFIKHFSNQFLDIQSDASVLHLDGNLITFTTDSFVVDPVFFPGGDIGKLAIAGTVNDLAVSGAEPHYLSASFIIEEGFPLNDLEKIVVSMSREATHAGVKIVTGDTKVVDKGKCDKVFINTTGIGLLNPDYKHIGTGNTITPGDQILINGTLADHGMCIMAQRENLGFETSIQSDCASLNHLIKEVLDAGVHIKFMRDATRGGLSTVIAELAKDHGFGILLEEEKIVVKEEVRGICELLGFDPLYVANEGKVMMVVAEKDADKAKNIMQQNALGIQASIIGRVTTEHAGKAWLTTSIGGKRIIDMLAGEQLPRIC